MEMLLRVAHEINDGLHSERNTVLQVYTQLLQPDELHSKLIPRIIMQRVRRRIRPEIAIEQCAVWFCRRYWYKKHNIYGQNDI